MKRGIWIDSTYFALSADCGWGIPTQMQGCRSGSKDRRVKKMQGGLC